MLWIFDGLVVFFILLLGYNGFKKGLIEELGRLLGLVVALLLSISQSTFVSIKIDQVINADDWVIMFFSFSILFIIVLLVTRIITKMFHIALLSKNNQLMNRSLGFTFGAIKGYIIFLVFVWLVALLPLHKWTTIIENNSRLALHGNKLRSQVVSFFNWEDPISLGESYIKQLTQP